MKKALLLLTVLFLTLAGCTVKVDGIPTEPDTEPTAAVSVTEGTEVMSTEPTHEETETPTSAPTEPPVQEPTEAVVTVDYPDSALIESGEYHYCLCGDKEYAVQVAISINQRVTDLTLSSIVITEEGDELVPVYTLDELTPEKPIVADLSFPGDMSAYAISYTGNEGVVYIYSIYQSGMDGSIVLTDYVPFIV